MKLDKNNYIKMWEHKMTTVKIYNGKNNNSKNKPKKIIQINFEFMFIVASGMVVYV